MSDPFYAQLLQKYESTKNALLPPSKTYFEDQDVRLVLQNRGTADDILFSAQSQSCKSLNFRQLWLKQQCSQKKSQEDLAKIKSEWNKYKRKFKQIYQLKKLSCLDLSQKDVLAKLKVHNYALLFRDKTPGSNSKRKKTSTKKKRGKHKGKQNQANTASDNPYLG